MGRIGLPSASISKRDPLGNFMGYLFAFFSVIANAVKGFCSKKISSNVESAYSCVLFNIIRMLFCCLISLGYTLLVCKLSAFEFRPLQLLICFVSGLTLAVNVVCWTLAIKSDAYMFVSATSSAGFVIPLLFGLLLFGEKLTVWKGVAVLLIVTAMYFLLKYNLSFKPKMTPKGICFLILIFLSQGFNQTMQKMYTFYLPQAEILLYTLYSFIFTEAVLLLWLPFLKRRTGAQTGTVSIKKNFKYILTMAIAIFAVSYFQSLAARQVEAIILYPMINALSLIAGSLMATLLFREKFKKECLIGILLVFAALVLSRM